MRLWAFRFFGLMVLSPATSRSVLQHLLLMYDDTIDAGYVNVAQEIEELIQVMR